MIGKRLSTASLIFIVLTIGIIPLLYFSVNFRWQILDDGLIWNRNLYPPFAAPAIEFTESVGRNYIGLGILIELLWFTFGSNVLGYFILNYLIWVAVSSLSFVLIWRATNKRLFAVLSAVGVYFIPTSPEIFLTLIKFEKFSALAILLVLLGLQQFEKTKDFQQSWKYFLSSLAISIMCSKETIVFYLIPIICYALWKSMEDFRNPKNTRKIIAVSSVLLFFIAFKYLYPSIVVNSDGYTSGFGLRSFSEIRSNFVSYIYREPTVAYLIGFNVFLTVLKKVKNIQTSSLADCILFIGLFEFMFFLIFWNQVQVYYLYNVELALLLSLLLNLSDLEKTIKQTYIGVFLVPALCFAAILSLNIFVVRSISLTQSHLIDWKLIKNFQEMKGETVLNFPVGSEMPTNISYITGYKPKLLKEFPENTNLCNLRFAFLHASPSNIAFGVRGINWDSLETQKNILSAPGIEIIEEYNFKYQKNFWVLGTELPEVSSLIRPKNLKFEYGLSIQKVNCD
jgi:hypothetical protein